MCLLYTSKIKEKTYVQMSNQKLLNLSIFFFFDNLDEKRCLFHSVPKKKLEKARKPIG
jgi:hypothetical protein